MGTCGTRALVETCSFSWGLGFVLLGKDAGWHRMGCTVMGAVTEMNSTEGVCRRW